MRSVYRYNHSVITVGSGWWNGEIHLVDLRKRWYEAGECDSGRGVVQDGRRSRHQRIDFVCLDSGRDRRIGGPESRAVEQNRFPGFRGRREIRWRAGEQTDLSDIGVIGVLSNEILAEV